MVTLRLIDERDPFRPTASRELSHGEMSVGRDPGADWRIDDPERRLSRIHCVFSIDRDGAVNVRDTSSNGVFRETGDRLPLGEPMPVKIGDGVRIGNFMIYVDRAVVSPPEPSATVDGASRATPPALAEPVHDGALIEAFCQGAQIDSSHFAAQDPAELLRRLGAIYRETIIGLGHLMEDRSAARQGIDLDRTTIGASRNNPFKWAAPARLTLDLLRGGNEGFMSGAEAVASSFRDIRSHLTALSGAGRSAITNTLATLDPAAIEEETAHNSSLFSTGRASANWKKYRMLHKQLLQTSEADGHLALVTALRAADAAVKERAEGEARQGHAR